MPNVFYFIELIRNWRIDTQQVPVQISPSTPIINVIPNSVEEPEKKKKSDDKNAEKQAESEKQQQQQQQQTTQPKQGPFGWLWTTIKGFRPWLKSAPGEPVELQTMLPSSVSVQKPPPTKKAEDKKQEAEKKKPPEKAAKGKGKKAPAGGGAPGICLMTESPYRIIKAAESGNLDAFKKLYYADTTRLTIQDHRGRSCTHQAAFRNRIPVLEFIRSQGADLNIKDNAGNTPLHVAVENEALDAVDYLLRMGVATNILNEKKQAIIHLATELNKVCVLKVMGKYTDMIDIQQGGEHGRTALHIAAIYDQDECATLLIKQFDACPRKPCNNGYYPIHEAAKNASSKTLEVFLQWGESRGSSREEMISFFDAEGNVPLHSAVHGGDIKAVELCLKSGAKISTQQHDLSTPVHLACSQGATEIVKLMFKMQPEEKVVCLTSCDVQKMTPLHCAAMFDHPDIVEYLVSEGGDINQVDKEKRSPLLLAALRGGWRTVHVLIRLQADIHIKDVNKRNVLHLVVMNGGRLEQFAAEVSKAQSETGLLQLLNEKDITGCSPLHYASREGHIRSLENLIKLGACINLKNNNNESPLHFAARYGRYNTVKQLLDSEKGTFIINESDGEGLTPLHICSQHGHTKLVQLLLNRGALLHRDHNGRNPLHLAAMCGFTQTVEMLYTVHSHLLDQADKDGNTALHLATMENQASSIVLLMNLGCKLLYNHMDMSAMDYAIYYKYSEAALAMVTHEKRAEEVMLLKSNKHPCVTLALIASMPRVFESVQDKCIEKADCKKDSKQFYVKYDFTCLQCPQFYADMDEVTGEAYNISEPIPLPALNAMVVHGRVELLAHPLSQKYLQMKWNSYGKYFHVANVLFYSIFLGFVTCFSSQMMVHDEKEDEENLKRYLESNKHLGANISNYTQREYLESNKAKILEVSITPIMYISGLGIMAYISLNSIREFVQVYQQKFLYFLDPINLVSWILYSSSILMVTPIFGGKIIELQFSCASLTVFLSWFNLLLLLQRFDQVGIYVVMFLEILQTLIKVLMVFSILIIAFGLAFYILLSRGEHLSFRSVPMSLVRTFSMMLGEIDFLGTYVQPYYLRDAGSRSLPFAMPTFLILGIFMVLMPILLMNLLIGLAVGDIESVRRNAQLKRLAMQVVLHSELERKIPKVLLEKVDKSEIIEYPNDAQSKLGFLDSIFKKWFGSPFSEEGPDPTIETPEDLIISKIEKTKTKLRDLTRMMESQQQLLRLIVQKMEIKTEAEDVDEGMSPSESRRSKWTSPKLKSKLKSALSLAK